jgi:uncharacterized protein YtpQ (UPF0354 family)
VATLPAPTTVARVCTSSTTFLPIVIAADDEPHQRAHVLDGFVSGLAVAYSFGPPYGERLVSPADLADLGLARRELRRAALDHLGTVLGRVRVHGRPPVLRLSFDGLESSVLLAQDFWPALACRVPGELVVGVPARDVVVVTGSLSEAGMETARQAVDRVFFAGDQHLLSRSLLAWRRRGWEILPAVGRRSDIPQPSGPAR